jgi:hypothetical protein
MDPYRDDDAPRPFPDDTPAPRPRRVPRPPRPAEIREAAREIEDKLAIKDANWKTSALGALAILCGVATAVLRSMGYEAPSDLVALLTSILAGSGLIAASDSRRPQVLAVPVPVPTPGAPADAAPDDDFGPLAPLDRGGVDLNP